TAKVFVFEPTEVRLQGYLRSIAETARDILPDAEDVLALDAVRRYFELHYWKKADRWDARGIMDCFPAPCCELAFRFRTASDAFRFIDDQTRPVFVSYGRQGERLVNALRRYGPSRDLLRSLQRFTVGLYDH